MSSGHTRPASRRQAELDDWLSRAADEEVIDLASLRGTMRAPTNLLQQLAEAVLDSSVSILPDGGLPNLRRAWAAFEAQQGRTAPDPEWGMTVVADPLAACAATVLGLVSPGRHVAVVEPIAPQVVDAIRRVGAMARTVAMRPTEWEFVSAEFANRVGPQTELIIVADPNPLSGQYLPDEARAAIIAAVQQFGCYVLLDQSARLSVVEEVDENAEAFVRALGANCLCVDVAPASVLATSASAAAIMGAPELVAPVRSAASTFGLGASVVAQSVLAQRFADGKAIDDAATVQGVVSSGRALLLDGLDDIGVLGLGGPGGWFVPVRAQALYEGTDDIGEVLAAKAGLGVLPLAPFYAEGSSDPYILMSYVRDSGLLEDALERLSGFYADEAGESRTLALPPPGDWDMEGAADYDDDLDDDDFEDDDFEDDLDIVTDEEDEIVAADADDVEDEPDPLLQHEAEPAVEPAEEIAADRSGDGPVLYDALAEDDAKYRAAMAGTVDGPGLADGFEDEPEGDAPDGEPRAQSGKRRDSVILPFGRWRRGARERAEEVPEEGDAEPAFRNQDEDDEQAGQTEQEPEEVPVFKLSVPDIASPNIAAPVTPSEPGTAPEPSPASDERQTEHRDSDHGDERAGNADAEERRRRDRRDDRPFFSDDPVI